MGGLDGVRRDRQQPPAGVVSVAAAARCWRAIERRQRHQQGALPHLPELMCRHQLLRAVGARRRRRRQVGHAAHWSSVRPLADGAAVAAVAKQCATRAVHAAAQEHAPRRRLAAGAGAAAGAVVAAAAAAAGKDKRVPPPRQAQARRRQRHRGRRQLAPPQQQLVAWPGGREGAAGGAKRAVCRLVPAQPASSTSQQLAAAS